MEVAMNKFLVWHLPFLLTGCIHHVFIEEENHLAENSKRNIFGQHTTLLVICLFNAKVNNFYIIFVKKKKSFITLKFCNSNNPSVRKVHNT